MSRRFAAPFFHDRSVKSEPSREHEIAFCIRWHFHRDICDAAGLKTDIHWYFYSARLAESQKSRGVCEGGMGINQGPISLDQKYTQG
ncbi:MAG: hypothetical protein KGJ00_14720, partial [Bradyrhizobium sp.]|nr:hypothetical protein [Bradyrhizobium sp.]